jgi:hypothetical protein
MHLLIGEADHGIAESLQVSRPRAVVFDLRRVAIAVDLDHELGTSAAKVHDKAPDGMLAPKLEAKQLLAAQPGPQLLLRRCLFAPKLFCTLLDGLAGVPAFVVGYIVSPPPLNPPRFAGGKPVLPPPRGREARSACCIRPVLSPLCWGKPVLLPLRAREASSPAASHRKSRFSPRETGGDRGGPKQPTDYLSVFC